MGVVCGVCCRFFFLGCVAFASGCASITGSEIQNLSIEATDAAGLVVAGADCRASNDRGAWSVKSPGAIMVHRSAEDLHVHCEAAAHEPGSARAISRVNAAMFGNIIFGGVVGAVIDHSKGTAYEYPAMIRVVLGANRVIQAGPEASASAGSDAASARGAVEIPPGTRRPEPVASAAPATKVAALPNPGTSYRYRWTDRQFGRRQEFTVRVSSVDGWNVSEQIGATGMRGRSQSVIDVREAVFSGYPLGSGQTLLEFAPYLAEPRDVSGVATANYPQDAHDPWTIRGREAGWEQIVVPAGSYRAMRIDILGTRTVRGVTSTQADIAGKFEYSVWYAPEISRYVKAKHRIWNANQLPYGEEEIELLELGTR